MVEVTLEAISRPAEHSDVKTTSDLVAYFARVSNPANQNNTKTAKKLLKSLIRDKHWSPLEMVHLTMKIVTTRDISKQIIRHRSFSYQEFSQRYAITDFPVVFREARLQDSKNRQNSISIEDARLKEEWNMHQAELYNLAKEKYNWAIMKNIAKECARAVLPEGNTETTLYMAGSLRSWVHYCLLRMANGTQKEHAEIAKLCWEIIKSEFYDIATTAEEVENSTALKVAIYDFVEEYMPDTMHKIKLDFMRLK